MVMILTTNYPAKNEVFLRIDAFSDSSLLRGGILIVGKDNKGGMYRPKSEPFMGNFYALPDDPLNPNLPRFYKVAISNNPQRNHPALFFSYVLAQQNPSDKHKSLDSSTDMLQELEDITSEQEFMAKAYDRFDLRLMDERGDVIPVLDTEVERIFKQVAIHSAVDLSKVANETHLWDELLIKKTKQLELFLDAYRKMY